MGLNRLAMVTSPTGKGVIAMGGSFSKAMFELTQSMEWTRLEQTLQIDHWAPLAIPIPDEFVNEKIKEKNNFNLTKLALGGILLTSLIILIINIVNSIRLIFENIYS